jgi:competence protein ComEA
MVMVVTVMVNGKAHIDIKAICMGFSCQLPRVGLGCNTHDPQEKSMQLKIHARCATATVLLALALAVAAQTTNPSGGTGPVPAKIPPPGNAQQTIAQKIAASKDLMDINTATASQLKTLPGMGDAYVARIIAGRPYTAKNQLVQRGILPQNVYAGISGQIIAHRPKK